MRHRPAVGPPLQSFCGGKDELTVHQWVPVGKTSGCNRGGPDMIAMARAAMKYLVGNPQKPLGWQCRFALRLLEYPPAPLDDQLDQVSIGDTESRMELEFLHMREMTGSRAGAHIENGIRSRLLSFVRRDGLCWCNPRCLGGRATQSAAMSWTTAYLLLSTAHRYRVSHKRSDHELCRRLIHGLRSLAKRRGNILYYPGGLAAWRRSGWGKECRAHYPSIVPALVYYWQVTGEADILEFAEGMAEGIIAGAHDSLNLHRMSPDGSHCSSNVHLTMRGVLGVAQLGALAGNARYVEWARRIYEYTRSLGMDWGWYPESFYRPECRYRSETCVTADMTECAVAFAQAGYPEYWDHVERTVRNYLPQAQFFLTPGFVALYRETHEAQPANAARGLEMLKRLEGGFVARLRPNDWVYQHHGRRHLNMMGCCPPSGMHALYLAWANTVVERDGQVHVNMALDCDTPLARVVTLAPKRGRTVVKPRKAGVYLIRPPSWSPAERVTARRNGRIVKPDWHRFYLRFLSVRPGDLLQLDYPLPCFSQRVAIGCPGSEESYTLDWVGNDVVKVSPAGGVLPIFSPARRRDLR